MGEYKLVIMKVLIILGVLCRLACSRYIVVENGGQMTSPPVQMTSQPMHVTSPPMQMTSPPVHMISKPVQITSSPVQVTSPPVPMTSQPMQMIQPQPMHVTSPPVQMIQPQPMHMTSQPMQMMQPQPCMVWELCSQLALQHFNQASLEALVLLSFKALVVSSSKVLEQQCTVAREFQPLAAKAVHISNLAMIPCMCRVLKVVDLSVLPKAMAKLPLWVRGLQLVLELEWLDLWVQGMVLLLEMVTLRWHLTLKTDINRL